MHINHTFQIQATPSFFDSQTNFVEKELFNIVGKEIGSQECKSRAK